MHIAYTTAFVTPVVVHWVEREIAQWVHSMKDRSDDPSHHERMLVSRSYIRMMTRLSYLETARDIEIFQFLVALPRGQIQQAAIGELAAKCQTEILKIPAISTNKQI